jgi:hypothetical protein
MVRVSVFIACLLLLVGCSSTLTTTTSTFRANNSLPILMLTSTKTPSLLPSRTPFLRSTITHTPTLFFTPTITPTTDPAVQIAYSPDGQFIAKLYDEYSSPTGFPTIYVIEKDRDRSWTIPYQGKLPEGYPRPYLSIYKWAEDSSALYFYYAFSFDGAPTLSNGYNLQKFNIRTGKIQNIISGQKQLAFAISPDGNDLAYIRQQGRPDRIIIRDLSTGKERTATIPASSSDIFQAGWIAWSPDGMGVLFQTWGNDNINDKMQAIYLNVDTMKLKILLDFWSDTNLFDGWSDAGSPRFLTYPNMEVVTINIDPGAITIIGTQTPTPALTP